MTRRVTLIETRKEISLLTTFQYPPIPIRSMDWSAIDDNTYDGCNQSPHGVGATEIGAINDLFDQLLEA